MTRYTLNLGEIARKIVTEEINMLRLWIIDILYFLIPALAAGVIGWILGALTVKVYWHFKYKEKKKGGYATEKISAWAAKEIEKEKNT